MLPSIFISHGSPMLMLRDNSTTRFFQNLPSTYKKPEFILVISAHWVTKNLKILYEESPSLIYDFYGFPKELYDLKYDAISSKEKSDEIALLFEQNGISIEKDDFRSGYDHGVWSVLRFMYPDADVPVLQLSIPQTFTEEDYIKMGEILQPLRENTLIIGSGSLTHNLMDINWDENTKDVKDYSIKFHDFVTENLKIGNYKNLIEKAPFLRQNHPTLEHFIPLLVNIGSSKDKIGESANNVYMHGNLSMDSIVFKG
jgi:4,5-DOPA dioxygenase extradiol